MGMIPATVWTVARTFLGAAVLLRLNESETVVPIYIGALEAQSIVYGLAGREPERPLTHDLMVSAFSELGVEITRIDITEIKENTFYAQLHVTQDEVDYSIDSRPSDSIALAVRVKCPIFIDEDVVSSAGRPLSEIAVKGPEGEESVQTEKTTELSEADLLRTRLQEAVESENYEEAATIRDRLRQLGQSSEQG
jgi:bifunctional DNase/RNase